MELNHRPTTMYNYIISRLHKKVHIVGFVAILMIIY